MEQQTLLTRIPIALRALLLGTALVLSMRSPTSLAAPAANVRYVQADGASGGACDSWATACTLQAALSVAVDGDQIWVAAGIHTPTSTSDRTLSFQLKSGVALYGGFSGTETRLDERNPNPATNGTILSGEIGDDNGADNSYHVVASSGVTETAVLDGFTITAGNADGEPYDDGRGGGMHNDASSPTVRNCIFLRNAARYGGGMFNGASSPAVSGCAFIGNSANGGGGMFNFESTLTLTQTAFTGNAAGWGGAMVNDETSATATGCAFVGNSADVGGGMYNDDGRVALDHCTFTDNAATDGGGALANDDGATVVNASTFTGNSAVIYGGAMVNSYGLLTLTNCTFAGNSAAYGGALVNFTSSPTVTHSTFAGNLAGSGGALYNLYNSSPVLTNCILWGSDSPEEIASADTSFPVVTYSDVQGGYAGTGNIDEDPLFVDPGSGDVHLQPDSPCIDAGTNAAPAMPDLDFEGDPRVSDGNWDRIPVADMGVDEAARTTVYLPLALVGH